MKQINQYNCYFYAFLTILFLYLGVLALKQYTKYKK